LVAGYIVDKTGNWELTFVGSIGLLLVGSILAFWMKPDEGLDEGSTATLRKSPVAKPAA
jgi:cyanate permease